MKLRKLSVITYEYGIPLGRTEIEHHAAEITFIRFRPLSVFGGDEYKHWPNAAHWICLHSMYHIRQAR